jgi:TonB-linked SusC/RagA family outer membrane protein
MNNKAFLLLFCFFWSPLILQAQNNRLTAHLKQVSLGQVFELIQQQSEYILFYMDTQVDLTKKVSVDAENMTIEEILDQVLEGTNLKYKIFERQVIIVQDKTGLEKGRIQTTNETEQKKRRIEGKVIDENENPVFGVSVLVKGTQIGVITNLDGFYSLDVPIDAAAVLFSFVGMKTVEEKLNGRTRLDVVMISDDFGVEEVVVSALGIKRAEKALTYSTQTISAEEISNNRELSFVNSLSGKISGMEINRSAAGAGGSTKVILRGNKSLNSSSEPLFVIDGIPMANNKGEQLGLFGGADQGDGLSQLNTDDIESISILKGANAAALYGSQGANGVILITTRKGEKGALKVSFYSGTMFEKVQDTPDFQFRYGSIDGSKESWSTIKGNYADNYIDDFFQTGSNLVNTITLSGGNDRTTVYSSFSNTTISGIVPQNRYQKSNLSFKQSTRLFSNRVTFSSSVFLTDEITRNKNVAGYYYNPLTGLYLFPRDRNFASFSQNYQEFDELRNMYLQNWFVSDHFQSNPNWIINNQTREDLNKRIIGSIHVECDIIQDLKLQLRGNYDYATRSYEQQNKAGSNATNVHPNGSWSFQKVTDELFYGDAILTYNKRIDNISLNTVFGTSYQKSIYGLGFKVNSGTDGLIYPNEFSFQNLEKNVLINSVLSSRLVKEAVFSNVQLGYKDKLFLDLSGRNDWSSSLYGTGNDSYFYPSVGVTAILNELFRLPDFVDFGKVRSSYSFVANEVPFNTVSPNHTITATGVNLNTTKPFTNLKPEMIRSVEVGTNWRLFKSLIGFDLTYYNINSRDQFISLPAPSGSGYTRYFVNAGEIINSGIELSLNTELVRTKKFNWHSIINYADNKNKIVSLHPDLKNPISLSDNEGYQLIIKEGGSFGDIYVHKFLRDDEGRIKLDVNGNIPKTEQKEYIGNSNPRWSLGWNNRFRFKNLTLGFLVNGKFGGKVISQTEAMLDGYGVSERSADARDNGGVVIDAVMPDGTAVTTMDAKKYYTTIGDRDGIKEPYTYDRTNIRLAQFSLSYDWNLQHSAVSQINVSLVGQNLFFLYKDAPYDPEVILNTLIVDQAIDNFSLPTTRTVGFSFKISF